MGKFRLPMNTIRYTGIFDLNTLVNAIMGWFTEDGWEAWENTHKYKLLSAGASFEVKIQAFRNMTPYFRYEVTLKMKSAGCREVEIKRGKKVVKAWHGRVVVWIIADMVYDWQGKYKDGYLKVLHSFWFNFVIIHRALFRWDDLFYKMQGGLEPAIKKALQFNTVMSHG